METSTTQLNLSGLFPDFGSLGGYPDTPEQLSALFVAILLMVASTFFITSLLALFKALQRTDWLRKLLANETSQSIFKNRRDLREKADTVSHNAGHLWKEFDETLIEVEVGDDIHLHNIYDASHFFNSSTLARRITESRMLAAVPGFLTALGVIGTFVGLQLGLSELNIGNNVAVAEMKAGLAHVIGGAKIAFMTSVWGVTLSVIFNFVEKGLERVARDRIYNIQTRIDELFPRLSAESQLQQIAHDGAQSRESLQGMAEHIGQKMQESLLEATTGIQQGLEASLEKIMAPAINKLVNETTDGNQKALEQLVEGFLDKFGEQGNSQRQAMDAASKDVGEALSSMSSTLEGFIHHMEQNQTAAMERERTLSDGLQQTIENIEQNLQMHTSASSSLIEQGKGLQQQIETSASNHESIAEGLQLGAMELHSAAEKIKEYGADVRLSSQQLGGVLKEVAESTAELVAENRKTNGTLEQVHQKVSDDIAQLEVVIDKLGSVVNSADATFSHMEEHQKRYLEALKENVASLAEQMTQLLSDYAEQANAQTASHLNMWAEHTTNYAQQMNSAAQALSGVVDEIEVKLGS